MPDQIRLRPPGTPPVAPVPGPRPGPAQAPAQPAGGFDEALRQAMAPPPLRLSAHAQDRLRQRPLSAGELARVSAAVDQAARKGARASLVLLRDVALVVSVQNRTVITAVTGDRMKDNVFTQIDSAILVTQ